MYRGPDDVIRESVIICLVNLARLFTPGVKLTLVARHLSDDSAFMIFSEDSLPKVVETIQQHIKTQGEGQKFNGILPANDIEV